MIVCVSHFTDTSGGDLSSILTEMNDNQTQQPNTQQL